MRSRPGDGVPEATPRRGTGVAHEVAPSVREARRIKEAKKAAKREADFQLAAPEARRAAAARAEEIARRGREKMVLALANQAGQASRPPRPRVARPVRDLSLEETRAVVRRGIVTRRDGKWEAYGIGLQERQGWEKAGLGYFQAHIPAMCRSFGSPRAAVTAKHLHVLLPSGLTVQQAFEAGDNIVQVMDQLAAVTDRSFSSAFGARAAAVVPVLREAPPKKSHVVASSPGAMDAAGVPSLSTLLIRATRPSPSEQTVDAFNRERKQFDRTGHPGPLVKLYAEAHGIFDDMNLTRRLLQNVPPHVVMRVQRLPLVNLIADALRERQFYYLSRTATAAVEADADPRIPIPEEYDLPTPTGFALLRDTDMDGQPAGRILLWSHGARELTAAIVSVADLAAGLTEFPNVRTAPIGSVGNADAALALVAAIGAATRRPPGDLDTGAREAPRRLPGGMVKPRPRKPLVDEAGDLVDFVSLIYAPGEAHFEESQATGRKAEKRWVVRGHWRQQWYSSTGERHPLWIKAHEAGADEGELLTGDRVRVNR
ncbi:hypothetical protein [Cryobacterium sinapicolor]|uniref:hypothetical protein n=1 Tax=Cryobacterium sinapicolor TaxID=1259236 RepID=UPI00141ACE27|nr:hypothetical protein [Cryobacterium sinapicolor]